MRITRPLAIVLGVALLGASCGGDDDDTSSASSATASPASTAAVTATTAASTASTAAATATTATPTTATTEPADTCTDERKGGEITMGVRTLARGLDPTVALGTGAAGATELTAIFDTLTRYVPDTGEVVPNVAESVEPNADNTVWTLKLPAGVTFGNGDPLTAEAVRFSVERMAKGSVQSATLAQEVASMNVVDDLTIEFTMKQPWGSFPYFLATEGGMVVNPAVVTAMGDQFASNPAGGGVGPYEVQSFEPNVGIVLTAKDDYWGGPVCVDTLNFIHVQGDRGTYEAFQKDEMDVMFVEGGDVLNDVHNAGVEGFATYVSGGVALYLNMGRGDSPVMADVRLRQAVAHAIDQKLVADRVFNGFGRPNSGLTDPDQSISTGIEGPAYDPDAAKALVAEAKADGFDGNVTLSCQDTPVGQEISITLKGLLDAVGFNTTVENLPQPELTQKFAIEGKYEIACGALGISAEGYLRPLGVFRSDSARNRTGLQDPATDAAINKLYAATDADEVTEAMRELGEAWNDAVPVVSLWSEEWFVGRQPDVHGLVMNRDGVVMFQDAWVEQ